MIWMARVSSNQRFDDHAKLLRYCLNNAHWSVFDMIDVIMEVETSMPIGEQILRHWSFRFQKFSGRYASMSLGFEFTPIPSMQGSTNRQGGSLCTDAVVVQAWRDLQTATVNFCEAAYKSALSMGISREDARMLLPMMTRTKFYMKGSLRSWIFYLTVRDSDHAQHQHRDLAKSMKRVLAVSFPVTWRALGWTGDSYVDK